MKDENGIEYSLDDFFLDKHKKKIIVFGAGKYGQYICNELALKGYNDYTVCDNNSAILKNIGVTHAVIGFDDLIKNVNDYTVLIAVTDVDIIKSIKNQLLNNGFNESDIVIPIPDSRSYFFDFLITYDNDLSLPVIKQQWLKNRRTGKKISDYFEKNELFSLVVYESDKLLNWLNDDLKETKVSVKHIISNTDYLPDIEGIDAILVLDEVNFDYIQEKLIKEYYVPIIGIWDVIR